MKKIKVKGKNYDECCELAIEQLKVPASYIKFNKLSEKSGLFKSECEIEAIVNIDIKEYIKNYLEKVYNYMGVEATISQSTKGNDITYTVDSKNNSLLIGKEGRTLSAIQSLLRSIALNLSTEKFMIYVDIGNYKENRIKQLEILATKTAKEVSRTGIEVKLKAMNSYERRIVHSKLSTWDNIITESEGKEPNRYLVIKSNRK